VIKALLRLREYHSPQQKFEMAANNDSGGRACLIKVYLIRGTHDYWYS